MSTSRPDVPDLVWEIATLYPQQGSWSEAGYLAFTESTNRLIEFTDGRVEFLAMPTKSHQLILMFLLDALRGFVTIGQIGLALPAPLRVRIRPGKFREPDIVFMKSVHADRAGDEYFDGADLVMEIVSDDPESRKRDLVEKVLDYSEASIPEYWIVDPMEQTITVCTQPDATTGYQQRRSFARGQTAVSTVVDGFAVDVSAAIDSGN